MDKPNDNAWLWWAVPLIVVLLAAVVFVLTDDPGSNFAYDVD